MKRCAWAKKPLEQDYHDHEWCKPCHQERKLFEFLILEGMQAGLSWNCILKKRAAMKKAFFQFDPKKIVQEGPEAMEAWLSNPELIRNHRKLEALLVNAQHFIEVQQEWKSFDAYIWHFTQGKVIDHHLKPHQVPPAHDALSDEVSKDLKARGFKFVGSTIIYSYLQAIGIVNDHEVGCSFR